MLVFSRRAGEGIILTKDDKGQDLAEPIEVIVQEVRGNQVKLAIKAPRDVEIVREEIRNTKAETPVE